MNYTASLFICLSMVFHLNAQSLQEFFSTSKVDLEMVGIDFSEVKLVGSEGFSEPSKIQSYYFGVWNGLLVSEIDKYDIKSAFYRQNVNYNLRVVETLNQEVDFIDLVTNSTPDFFTNEQIQKMVNRYDCSTVKSPYALTLIAHSLNKLMEKGFYYVVIFDPKTKKVLLSERMNGDAGGFGFRNYWARSYYNVLDTVKKSTFKKWRKSNK